MPTNTVHVVRIETDACTTDMDGDDLPNRKSFASRHPGIAIDHDVLCQVDDPPRRTVVRISEADWPSVTDYAAAVAVNPEALTVSAMLDDGPARTSDRSVMDIALRANAAAEADLFVITAFPSILFSHAAVTLPPTLDELADLACANGPSAVHDGPFVHVRDTLDPRRHHLFMSGNVQNLRHAIAVRLAEIGAQQGWDIRTGSSAWSGTVVQAEIAALVDRFMRLYGRRIDPKARMVETEEGGPAGIDAVAMDFLAYERAGGFGHTISETNAMACAGDNSDPVWRMVVDAIVAAAAVDPPVSLETRAGLLY